MNEKSIIIIGAGIAGLSAGCYARMNGYRAQIFELHTQPGGLCTSWSRKGYTFDGCIHWLVGTGEKSGFHRFWDELGALKDKEIVDHDEFVRIVGKDGKTFIVYTDPDRLEQHMLALAPQDEAVIHELCQALRTFVHAEIPAGPPENAGDIFRMAKNAAGTMAFMGLMRKYGTTPIREFASRFTDPFLREALISVFDLPDFPMAGVLMSLGSMGAHDAGYPVGGSLSFARAIEKRFCDLGGEIHYRARVAKILVEEDRAVGVRLTDGKEYRADQVISAADGHATIFDMLDGKYLGDEQREAYDHMPTFDPIIQVSLGVDRDLRDEPHMVRYELERPLEIAGEARTALGVKHYGYDPTLAPEGKSVVEVMFGSNYGYWKKLADDPEHYDAEKKDIAIKVIAELETRYPGITRQVEVVDVATPLTYERYTGNWKGSMEGWLVTTQSMKMMMTGKGMSKTLPGLKNFYQIGQWVEPGGGLPPAVTSARGVIKKICKQDGKAFKTSLAG
jgi:phytoene dehydrogenase-like protein